MAARLRSIEATRAQLDNEAAASQTNGHAEEIERLAGEARAQWRRLCR